jgi:ABC-type transport system substrate-binding protein
MATDPNKEIVLIRNRLYRGDRPRRAPRIRFVPAPYDPRERIERAEQGKSHVVPVPTRVAHDLAQRYGINTGRFRIDRAPEVHYLILNDRTPLLRGNEPLRRAINLALDRRALVPTFVSGVATDQLTPAGALGFRDLKIYPLGRPDLRRARQLAHGNGRGGQVDFS